MQKHRENEIYSNIHDFTEENRQANVVWICDFKIFTKRFLAVDCDGLIDTQGAGSTHRHASGESLNIWNKIANKITNEPFLSKCYYSLDRSIKKLATIRCIHIKFVGFNVYSS